jgi:hypothetical protein
MFFFVVGLGKSGTFGFLRNLMAQIHNASIRFRLNKSPNPDF